MGLSKTRCAVFSAIVVTVFAVHTCKADLIVNGDFSSNALVNNSTSVQSANLGNGWYAAGSSAWDLSGGNANESSGGGYSAIAQANAISMGETGDIWNLIFDWNPTGAELLQYNVVAWDYDSGTPAGTDIFIDDLDFQSTDINLVGAGSPIWIDLVDGSINSGDSSASAGFSAAAGTNTIALNFADTAIEDYDAIGIRFYVPNTNTEASSGILDNVMISAVPEPGSLAFLGLGILGLVARRRR